MDKEQITLQLAQIDQAEEIFNVMNEVYEQMPCKSLLVCDDLPFIKRCIEKDGLIVVACNSSSRIVGYSMIHYPHLGENNLGRCIDLPQEELDHVAHFETTVVLPQYRGLGLQKAMQSYAEELIDKTQYKYIMCTVDPENKWSRHNVEKCGLHYVCTKEKYGGLLRDIMFKQL